MCAGEGTGDPGVCAVRARVPDASYVDTGTVELKGIAEPQAIHRVSW